MGEGGNNLRKILMVCLFGIFLIACSDADQTKNEETNEDVNEEEIEVVEDEPTVAAPDWEYEGIEDENLRLIVLEALDMSNQTDDDTKPTEEDLKELERKIGRASCRERERSTEGDDKRRKKKQHR